MWEVGHRLSRESQEQLRPLDLSHGPVTHLLLCRGEGTRGRKRDSPRSPARSSPANPPGSGCREAEPASKLTRIRLIRFNSGGQPVHGLRDREWKGWHERYEPGASPLCHPWRMKEGDTQLGAERHLRAVCRPSRPLRDGTPGRRSRNSPDPGRG